jgi:cyclic pyranopterin phosphate synthase
MPERVERWSPRSRHATIDQHLEVLCRIHARSPIRKVRFTGGEPLLRSDFATLVQRVRERFPEAELTVTTNGLELARRAVEIKEAGISRVNVSLDTLRPERMRALCGRDVLPRVLDGIDAARQAGLLPIKLNTVMVRSLNLDEFPDLVRFAARRRLELRFIELMDIASSPVEHREEFVGADEAIAGIETTFPMVRLPGLRGVAQPAVVEAEGRVARIGFIRPVSRPFCAGCDRLRVDAMGAIHTCLMADGPAAASTDLSFENKGRPATSWRRAGSMCSIGG